MNRFLVYVTSFALCISVPLLSGEEERFLVKTTKNPNKRDTKNSLKEKTGQEIGNALRKLNDLAHLLGELQLIVAACQPKNEAASGSPEVQCIGLLNKNLIVSLEGLVEQRGKLQSSPLLRDSREVQDMAGLKDVAARKLGSARFLQVLSDFGKALGALQLEVANLEHQLFTKVEALIENSPPFKKAKKSHLQGAFHRVKGVNVAVAGIVHHLKQEGEKLSSAPAQHVAIKAGSPPKEPPLKKVNTPQEKPTIRVA